MKDSVKLSDLTDALDMIPEESAAWLDTQTGQVNVISDRIMAAAEDGVDNADDLEDWEAEQVPVARSVLADGKRHLALPTAFDFHEYGHMERFIGAVENTDHADQLWRAIKGKGAFRHFKDTAHRLGVIDAWYRYRDEAAQRFMLDWAKAHGIPVEQKPGRIDGD